MSERHIGRSWWPSKFIEDACPCPKALCGLVVMATALPECPDHAWTAGKSLREIHDADRCPGPYVPEELQELQKEES